MGTTPPQSGAPFKDSLNSRVNNAPLLMPAPQSAALSASRSTQAFRSLVQLLQWTMATAAPSGVVTMSISG